MTTIECLKLLFTTWPMTILIGIALGLLFNKINIYEILTAKQLFWCVLAISIILGVGLTHIGKLILGL